MTQPTLRNPRRAASPAIRGYYFQFLCTIERWLTLPDKDVIWCEGNEDIDRQLADGAIVEEQVKHLAGDLTESAGSIRSSLLNFLVAFATHRAAGRRSCYIFRTTANLRSLQSPQLEAWLSRASEPTLNPSALFSLIKEAASKYGSSDHVNACEYITNHNLESEFLDSCSWTFGEVDIHTMRRDLVERVQRDPRCHGVNADLAVNLILATVTRVSSQPSPSDRSLCRRDFDILINDLLLDKLVKEYPPTATDDCHTVLATASAGNQTCAIALRFNNASRTRSELFRTIERSRNHPRFSGKTDAQGIFATQSTLDDLSTVDFDGYIVFGQVKKVRRPSVRARWLSRKALQLSNVRGVSATVALETRWLLDVMYPVVVPATVAVSDPQDPLLALAQIVAEWTATSALRVTVEEWTAAGSGPGRRRSRV